jgi:poly-beta-hydroxyalkanoate depolymerase
VFAGALDSDPVYLRRLAEYVQRGAGPDTHIVAVVEPTRPVLREVA